MMIYPTDSLSELDSLPKLDNHPSTSARRTKAAQK